MDSRKKILPQRADLAERLGMIKHEKIFRHFPGGREIDFFQTRFDLRKGGGAEPGFEKHSAERINITSVRDSAKERGFESGGAATEEWIIDDIADLSQAI